MRDARRDEVRCRFTRVFFIFLRLSSPDAIDAIIFTPPTLRLADAFAAMPII